MAAPTPAPSEGQPRREFTTIPAPINRSARSFHPGGVNVTHVDGSVAFYNNDIDRWVWRALGTAAGGESLTPQ